MINRRTFSMTMKAPSAKQLRKAAQIGKVNDEIIAADYSTSAASTPRGGSLNQDVLDRVDRAQTGSPLRRKQSFTRKSSPSRTPSFTNTAPTTSSAPRTSSFTTQAPPLPSTSTVIDTAPPRTSSFINTPPTLPSTSTTNAPLQAPQARTSSFTNTAPAAPSERKFSFKKMGFVNKPSALTNTAPRTSSFTNTPPTLPSTSTTNAPLQAPQARTSSFTNTAPAAPSERKFSFKKMGFVNKPSALTGAAPRTSSFTNTAPKIHDPRTETMSSKTDSNIDHAEAIEAFKDFDYTPGFTQELSHSPVAVIRPPANKNRTSSFVSTIAPPPQFYTPKSVGPTDRLTGITLYEYPNRTDLGNGVIFHESERSLKEGPGYPGLHKKASGYLQLPGQRAEDFSRIEPGYTSQPSWAIGERYAGTLGLNSREGTELTRFNEGDDRNAYIQANLKKKRDVATEQAKTLDKYRVDNGPILKTQGIAEKLLNKNLAQQRELGWEAEVLMDVTDGSRRTLPQKDKKKFWGSGGILADVVKGRLPSMKNTARPAISVPVSNRTSSFTNTTAVPNFAPKYEQRTSSFTSAPPIAKPYYEQQRTSSFTNTDAPPVPYQVDKSNPYGYQPNLNYEQQRTSSFITSMPSHLLAQPEQRTGSFAANVPPVTPFGVTEGAKHNSHRNSLDLQHPQPRPGQPNQTNLEIGAVDYATEIPRTGSSLMTHRPSVNDRLRKTGRQAGSTDDLSQQVESRTREELRTDWNAPLIAPQKTFHKVTDPEAENSFETMGDHIPQRTETVRDGRKSPFTARLNVLDGYRKPTATQAKELDALRALENASPDSKRIGWLAMQNEKGLISDEEKADLERLRTGKAAAAIAYQEAVEEAAENATEKKSLIS